MVRDAARPLRLGLVGAGAGRSWAARAHLPALRSVPDLEVVAVATTRQETAYAAAQATGARYAFVDGRPLAEHPDVDVVSVVVKVPAHFELVGMALAAGKHVYCEWPLGVDLAEAQILRSEARRAGVVHMIGLQGRQSPGLLTARDLLQDKLVGRVLSCDMIHSTGHRGGGEVGEADVWGLDRSAGRNLLTIQGGHSFDAVCTVLGGTFTSVAGLVATRTPEATVIETGARVPVDTPDQVVVAGLVGDVPTSVHLQGGAPELEGFRMDIHGDRGVVRISGAGAHNSALVISSVVDGEVVDRIPTATRYLSTDLQALPDPAANVARQYRSLVAQITSGQHTGPSFDDAVHVHELLQAVTDSAESGRTVHLPVVAAHGRGKP